MKNQNEIHNLSAVAKITSAYLKVNTIALDDIGQVIKNIYRIVSAVGATGSSGMKSASTPAVAINESVTDEYIICLEDGKKLQMLKRHLSTVYGLTLEQYRARWNLPHDYPTTAPSYTRRRSEIARGFGLGKTRRGKAKSKSSLINATF